MLYQSQRKNIPFCLIQRIIWRLKLKIVYLKKLKLIVKLGSNFIIFFIQENFYQKEMSWKKQYKCLGTEMYQLLESLYLLMEIVILDVSIVMKNL